MERDASTDWFEAVRRAATTLWGVSSGLWIARGVGWLVELDGAVLGVIALVLGVGGGLLGWREARKLKPMESHERRDAMLGWSIVGLLIGFVVMAALTGIGD